MKASQKRKFFPLFILFSICSTYTAYSKALLFRHSADTQFPVGPLGHLMDLPGSWSLSLNANSQIDTKSEAYFANATIPVTNNTDSTLHGYYLSPSYFYSTGTLDGDTKTFGQKGWQIQGGRANLNFPKSIFRGFIAIGYRELSINDDSNTTLNQAILNTQFEEEKKRSVNISAGVSSTQNSLVSQKKPLFDTELILNLRYDYEKGDFYTLVKSAVFYPTLVDIGANLAWFKVYRENETSLYDEASDVFVFGPRLRARALKHLAMDLGTEWYAVRDFDDNIKISDPRLSVSLIASF